GGARHDEAVGRDDRRGILPQRRASSIGGANAQEMGGSSEGFAVARQELRRVGLAVEAGAVSDF
ncbi:MAG: hypothetical protein ACI8TQ_002374, partial [Planctomycetota bacterium]